MTLRTSGSSCCSTYRYLAETGADHQTRPESEKDKGRSRSKNEVFEDRTELEMARNPSEDGDAQPGQGAVRQSQKTVQQERGLNRLDSLDAGKILEIYDNVHKQFNQLCTQEEMARASVRAKEDSQREVRRARDDRELFKRLKRDEALSAGMALIRYVERLQRSVPGAKESDRIIESERPRTVSLDRMNNVPEDEYPNQEVESELRSIPSEEVEDWESVLVEDNKVYVLRCYPCIKIGSAFWSKALTEKGIRKAWRKHSWECLERDYGPLRNDDVVKTFGILVEGATSEWYEAFKDYFKNHFGKPPRRKNTTSDDFSESMLRFADRYQHDNEYGNQSDRARYAEKVSDENFTHSEIPGYECDEDTDKDFIGPNDHDGPAKVGPARVRPRRFDRDDESEDESLFMSHTSEYSSRYWRDQRDLNNRSPNIGNNEGATPSSGLTTMSPHHLERSNSPSTSTAHKRLQPGKPKLGEPCRIMAAIHGRGVPPASQSPLKRSPTGPIQSRRKRRNIINDSSDAQ
ncbi:hypothetical protein BKA64DRAFT_8251 [Cadophora sp. MPI-SDFR-AT-0126]|nr:hypothetical protein BKA64DRAFT_8251 [Leotiomycetes sp. MPI-SDFR-AT-0126]